MNTQEINRRFYEQITYSAVRSQMSAFSDSHDLRLIYPYLANTASIAELGACDGRCVDFLLNNDYTGIIYAVERVAATIEHLKEKSYPVNRIILVHQDITTLALPKQVDAMLWMGSGLIELTPADQLDCLFHLRGQLRPGGSLFIDVPSVSASGHMRFYLDNLFLDAYPVSKSTIASMAEQCRFQSSFVDYWLPDGSPRIMCTLAR